MDNQPITPSNSGPFSSSPMGASPGTGGKNPLILVFLIVLGLGTLIFGVLTVTFSSKAATATKTLETQKTAAAAKARDEQKKLDNENNAKANESPFRAYTAPPEYGSFVINFPKNWSGYVDQETSGTQIQLLLNPDFIHKTKGQDELMASRVLLIQRPEDQYLAQFSGLIKSGKLKQNAATVSGQPGVDLTGEFNDHKTVRLIVVPIRDKILVFTSENAKYAAEFAEILAQAKIIP